MSTMTQHVLQQTAWTADLRSGSSSVTVQNQSGGGPIYVHISPTPPSTTTVPAMVLQKDDRESFTSFGSGDGLYIRSEYENGKALVWK